MHLPPNHWCVYTPSLLRWTIPQCECVSQGNQGNVLRPLCPQQTWAAGQDLASGPLGQEADQGSCVWMQPWEQRGEHHLTEGNETTFFASQLLKLIHFQKNILPKTKKNEWRLVTAALMLHQQIGLPSYNGCPPVCLQGPLSKYLVPVQCWYMLIPFSVVFEQSKCTLTTCLVFV